MKKSNKSVLNVQVATERSEVLNNQSLKNKVQNPVRKFPKKTFFLLFLTLFLSSSFALQAQTIYDLQICGEVVTSDNCDDLSGIEGVEGSVTYAPDTKILTLDNVSITCESTSGIISYIEGLTIEVKNECTIQTSEDDGAVTLTGTTEITGSGIFNLNSYIFAKAGLTIKNCVVNIESTQYGIAGNNGTSGENITIENSNVYVSETSMGTIMDVQSLTFVDCAIESPVGAVFDAGQHAVVLDGQVVKDEIVIKSERIYDLNICGVNVTAENCSDLSAIEGLTGTASYDNSTKTLKLDGVTLDYEDANGIVNNIDGLTIELDNVNNITVDADAFYSIFANKKVKIMGATGTLVTNSDFYMDNDLTIENCNIEINSSYSGITGGEEDVNLEIINSNLDITGQDEGAIIDIASFTLTDCSFTTPAGAYFDAESGAVVDSDGEIATQVVISNESGLETSTALVSVFPNPVADVLRIDTPTNNISVEIFNSCGEKVLELKNTNEIDVSNLQQGVYFVKVYQAEGVFVNKIIKK